ncbi:MAG TPA: hypothetical protein VD948_01775, partial [Rhodothermales bacterium]|nr:hypothetical protein [Rhodothermales bacterium]
QYVVLSLGMLVATVCVLLKVDLTSLATAATGAFGEGGYNPVANSRFGWAFIVWAFISNLASAAIWQPGTVKALASESPAVAKRVFWITGSTFAGRAMIPMFWGIAALAVLGPNENSVAAMPKLLGQVVPSGWLGLLVAGMLAASMSTYSGYLLAWSSVLTLDVIAGVKKGGLSERATMLTTRIISTIIGVFLVVFGLLYQVPDTAYQYLFITGAMYTAGALGCVTAGLYWKRATTAGAYGALLLGALAPVAFLVLDRFRDALPDRLAFLTNVNVSGLASFALAAAGMIVGSYLSRRTDVTLKPVEVPHA